MTKAAQRLLVVDDEQTITQLMRFVFEDAGYQVVTASTCSEARAHFGEGFAAAILDKNMPDGDGIQLGIDLRRAEPFCETVLLTGYSNKETAIAAVGAGFFAYVEKPVADLDRFALLVKNAAVKSELQKRQQANERLIEHMRKMDALGRLASGVAHDFNNVLAVVGITAEVLTGEDLTLEDVRAHGRELLEVVNTGRALARQLVFFGKRSQTTQAHVSLNEVVNGMLALLQNIAGQRGLQLHLDAQLRKVRGCPDQLSQIVLNLLVNAADATAPDGHLTIRTRNVEQEVVLSVEDDGSGIAPETLEHMYEPYFTTKVEGKGTGLGLATVFGITQKHAGRLTVQSKVGTGTRFDVYLPAID